MNPDTTYNHLERAKDLMLQQHAKQLRLERPGLTHARSYQLAQEQHPDLAESFASDQEPAAASINALVAKYTLALCTCEATIPLSTPELVDEIVYLPRGTHSIKPKVNGVPRDITLTIDSSAAERLQADLERRLSQNVRPHGGFNHQAGPAAFVPKGFRWDPARGVMLKVDWSRSGRKAVLGNDYAYFSPCFLTDGSSVAGLPKTGEIGSLVNEPAFRDIPALTA